MSKGLIDIILDSIFDANWTGRRGEKLTERELNLVKFFGRKGKVLRNIYIPKDNGEFFLRMLQLSKMPLCTGLIIHIKNMAFVIFWLDENPVQQYDKTGNFK